MTTYPNREHERADKAARRRAITALDDIIADARMLQRRLEGDGYALGGSDVQNIVSKAVAAAVQFSALETLSDVREWHAADQATEARA